jgi:hypothetical protein
LTAAQVGVVKNVVVNEGRGVNEFHDHRQVGMLRKDGAGGAAGQKGERGAQAFAVTFDGISHVAFDGRVKGMGLSVGYKF